MAGGAVGPWAGVRGSGGALRDPVPLPQHLQLLLLPPPTASRARVSPPPPRPLSSAPVPCPLSPLPLGPALTPLPSPQAAPRWHPLLLALAAPVTAGDPAGARNDRAVAALLGLLLCLALGLALAWHHLCRLSDGRYHPRPLGRRALRLLRGQWHRLRAPGERAHDLGDRDGDRDGEVAVRDEQEELMPWSLEQRPKQQQEEEEEDGKEDEDEEEAEAMEESRERPLSEGEVAGGSAEALLSDLHAFSGTAAWGDTRPHVTAL